MDVYRKCGFCKSVNVDVRHFSDVSYEPPSIGEVKDIIFKPWDLSNSYNSFILIVCSKKNTFSRHVAHKMQQLTDTSFN